MFLEDIEFRLLMRRRGRRSLCCRSDRALSRVRGAALKETLGCQLLSTDWAQNLIWFPTDLQQALSSVGFTAVFAQSFLSLSVFIGTRNSLKLLTENARTSRMISSCWSSLLLLHHLQRLASYRMMTCWGVGRMNSSVSRKSVFLLLVIRWQLEGLLCCRCLLFSAPRKIVQLRQAPTETQLRQAAEVAPVSVPPRIKKVDGIVK